MPAFAHRASRAAFAARLSIASALATATMLSAAAAFASCASNPPRIAELTERHGTNCAPNCGFIIVTWFGNKDCDHYNIRHRGRQFEAPGTGNELPSRVDRRSAPFPGRFTPNNTIHVAVQGCEKSFAGGSRCTPWSTPVSFFIDDGSGRGNTDKATACRNYANRAVGAVKLARDTYKCDPKIISGPRWSSDREEHLRWCMRAEPATANFEDRARHRIAQDCRVQAGKPQGTASLTVTQPQRGDTFTLSGSGYAPNARVIIRVSGPAGSGRAITTNFADKSGTFRVTLSGAQVCSKAGTVTFTAEDQDKSASKPVSATCRP